MSRFVRLFVASTIFCIGFTAYADVYTWTDENGKVHYSDKPPVNTKIKAKLFIKGKGQQAATKPKPEEKPEPKTVEQTNEQIAKENAVIRKENCALASKRLNMLKSGTPVQIQDENGKIRTINAKERLELKKETQQLKQSFCGK